MILLRCTVYAVFLLRLVSSDEIHSIFEAENANTLEQKQVIFRSKASGKASLKMSKGQKASIEFCLTKQTDLAVQDVWYSNDGATDLIIVAVNNKKLGSVVSEPNNKEGEGWNIFKSNGPLDSVINMPDGKHELSLYVEDADEYGVELDKIELLLYNGQNNNILDCTVFCFDDISYDHNIEDTGLGLYTSKGTVVQNSVRTLCTEEDNINIPIFHDTARKFVISANLPKYRTFQNDRMPDWSDCKMFFHLWFFKNIDLSQDTVSTTTSGDATLSVKHLTKDSQSNLTTYEITVEFSLDGPSLGIMDSEMGSILSVSFREFINLTEISLRYFGRLSQWMHPTNTISPSDYNTTAFTWHIPDYMWREGTGNSVQLTLTSFQQENLHIEYITIKPRELAYDQSEFAYHDGMTTIEVVKVDGWWRINETMTLQLTHNGQVFNGIDYFRIYKYTPWSEDMFQVFVMYQDGNIRLNPITPDGLDWTPFGSSILLGQSDITAVRPAAALRHVDIDPKELTIQLIYQDGSISSLKLQVTIKETMVIVSNAVYARSLRTYPFLTFRSMWVSDGNADVDHVSVDGNEPHHILSTWNTLRGRSFAFFRKCISKHNTLSPDITVKILD
ncbi:hypothetical protein ACJMK2_024248 [Sinanodonta woodiana]|uniref:Uncharacterized protein n=1 Tax=Sinanodonta woodiana TaxID=1069815 RepID=A0ABD3T868_SINWO